VQTAVRSGAHVAPSISPSMVEAAENWLTYVELEGRERSTLAQYRQHVELHILPRLGHEKLAALTTPRINAFRDDLLTGLSRALARKVLTSTKSILKTRNDEGTSPRMSRATSASASTSAVSASSRSERISQRRKRSAVSSTPQRASGGRSW
jgi:integrase